MGLTRVIRFVQKAFFSLLPILFLLFITSPSFGNTAQYVYDDLGRLRGVFDENGNYAVYEYDEVGNILSVNRGSISTNPPLIQSISPDVSFIGSKSIINITGQNLLATREIVSDNPGISIKIMSVSDSLLKAEFTVANTALSGISNIIVNTSYGSATVGGMVLKLSLNPSQLSMTPGSIGNIVASISPVLGRALTITISNSDSSVISIPQSVIIPSNGTTNISFNALTEGVVVLSTPDSSMSFTTVYVTQPFTTGPGESVTSSTAPVSVYLEQFSAVEATITSLPVSVYIQPPAIENATTVALPVSVYINQPVLVDAIAVTAPVSIYITRSVEATAVSMPVSTQISPP